MDLSSIPGSDSLLELPRMLRDPIAFLEERFARHGSVFRTRFAIPFIFLVGKDANKAIHVTSRELFSYQEGFAGTSVSRLFNNSLIVVDGAPHKHDRDILQPAMGRLALEGSLASVQAIWDRHAKNLDDGTARDAYRFMLDATFEVSARVLVGLDESVELAAYRPLFQALAEGTMAHTTLRIPFLKLDRALKARNELIARLVPRIEAARLSERPRGMMGLLAHHREADGRRIDAHEIAEHLLLLFWAGYDTTASSGSWLLHHLAHSPEWQERLCREQLDVTGGAPMKLSDDKSLVQQTWVMRETERFRPTVLFYPRRTTAAFDFDGRTIPAGSFVMYTPYMTHRMPALFPDPHLWDPSRWDSSRADKAADATALVGFGGGPRICLGKAFAVMQLRVMLTTLLGRYRLQPDATRRMKVVPLPIHRPGGAWLLFHEHEAAHVASAA